MGLMRVKNWMSRKSESKAKEEIEISKTPNHQNKVDEDGVTPQ
jgi:hypothetical protein